MCLAANEPAQSASKATAEKSLLSNASPVVRGNTMDMVNGVPFIDKCLKASSSYDDYSFEYIQKVQKSNGGTVVEQGTLWIKKPNLLKVVVKSGPHAGSVAVFGPGGKVKAHAGGALKFFAVELSPDSSYLKSVNGWPMVQSDFTSIWKAMQGYAKDGCPCQVTQAPVQQPGQPMEVFVFEMTKGNGEMYKRALIEGKTMLPVEWWDYKNGRIYAHTVWSNFKGNQGLSDHLFTLKGKP
jgi:outer membrane lipoprotein-sorting protein